MPLQICPGTSHPASACALRQIRGSRQRPGSGHHAAATGHTLSWRRSHLSVGSTEAKRGDTGRQVGGGEKSKGSTPLPWGPEGEGMGSDGRHNV